jgi:hypothetical protein
VRADRLRTSQNAPSTHNRHDSWWQRFKDWLRSALEEEEPAKKEETSVTRL